MSPGQILDACSASLFALLGMWAALDRRHWFLRFAVVAPILLAALLIPAHLVVIEFGLQMMVIAAGVWLARLKERWPPRFSMETALLAMVVAAVGWAVLAAADELTFYEWIWCLKVGFCTGLIALACVELVFGHRGLLSRALLFILPMLASLGVFVLLDVVAQAVRYMERGNPWQDGLASVFTWQRVKAFVDEAGAPLLLGIPLILATLVLARESRWFHTRSDATPPPRWRLLGARVALTTIMLAVLTPCVYVFVELMTPTPFPPIVLPEPNGYEDIVAAGRMETRGELQKLFQGDRVNLSLSAHRAEVDRLQPMYDRIEEGLSKQVYSPYPNPYADDEARRDFEAACSACIVMHLRAELAMRDNRPEEGMEEWLRLLELGRPISGFYPFSATETSCIRLLRGWLSQLDPSLCTRTASRMLQYDSTRLSTEECKARWRIIYENGAWIQHVHLLMTDWSGVDRFKPLADMNNRTSADLRLLVVQLAVQAYCRERGTLPHSLDALVPEYLPEVPRDPFGNGPLQWKRRRRTLTLYSVGKDQSDPTDDITATAPAYTAQERTGFLLADLRDQFFGHWIAAGKRLYDDARAHLAPRQ